MSPSDQRSSPSSAGRSRGRSALDWAAQSGVADGVLRELEKRGRQRRRRRRNIGGAVGLFALMAATIFWMARAPHGEAEMTPDVSPSALVSLPERLRLRDGSMVELRDGAELREVFTATQRRVELVRGEAHFAVEKNPARPFIVVAGGIEVRAVGTAFSVQRGDEAVEVLVTEGRVAVGQALGPAPEDLHALAVLDAGRRVVVDTTMSPGLPAPAPVLDVAPAELAQRLAWRVPRLDFSGTPLGEAVPIFNQHSVVQLRLGDSSLAQLQVSGIIRADNPEPLLRLLRDNYGVVAERGAAGEFVLRRQP